MDKEKREACVDNLVQQIGWIEDIKAHQFPGWGHTVSAMRQAAALLKECGPRVMSLDEVKALEMDSGDNAPVWMETRVVTDKGILTYLEASILWAVDESWWRRIGPVHVSWEDIKAEEHNVTWRCWTSHPSYEQRRAEPWDG